MHREGSPVTCPSRPDRHLSANPEVNCCFAISLIKSAVYSFKRFPGMTTFTESVIEQAALAWLESVGWQVRNGNEIAPGEPAAERDDDGRMALGQRLRDALAHLNPAASPAKALSDALRKLNRPKGSALGAEPRAALFGGKRRDGRVPRRRRQHPWRRPRR